MDGHGIGAERQRLPVAVPVFGFAHRRGARTRIGRFNWVTFEVGDFHSTRNLISVIHRTDRISARSAMLERQPRNASANQLY